MEPDIFILLALGIGFIIGVVFAIMKGKIELRSGKHGILWFDDNADICRLDLNYSLEYLARRDRLIFKVKRKKNNSIYEQQNMKGE